MDPDDDEERWDEDENFWDDEDYDPLFSGEPCGCKYCYCDNSTIAGETCSECLAGSHQG